MCMSSTCVLLWASLANIIHCEISRILLVYTEIFQCGWSDLSMLVVRVLSIRSADSLIGYCSKRAM